MNHVCILATPAIYDGYGLKLEIHDWLSENVGQCASDMTDYVWGKKVGYIVRSSDSQINPMYLASGDRASGGKYLHFQFKDSNSAMLFKLRWSGQ